MKLLFLSIFVTCCAFDLNGLVSNQWRGVSGSQCFFFFLRCHEPKGSVPLMVVIAHCSLAVAILDLWSQE